MKKEEKINQLRQKANKARFALEEAEEQYRNETLLPEMRKLIGKCFKYYNSYGGDRARWNLYVKVIGLDKKTLNLKVVEFQKTSMGIVEIRLDSKITYRGENQLVKSDGYIPITTKEYNQAKSRLKKFIIKQLEL